MVKKRETAEFSWIMLYAAYLAHEDWRLTWRDQHGEEPRVKTTVDADWITKHGTDKVDIAHTTFHNLPNDWQKETQVSIEVALAAVIASAEAGEDVNTIEFVERTSALIHAHWRLRHGQEEWVVGSVLEGGYAQMSDIEKEKDRIFVRCAIDAYTQK